MYQPCLNRGLALPDSERIERKPAASLYEFAKEQGAAFHEIAPAGEPFTLPPPRVIGEGDHRALEGVSRAIFVACLCASSAVSFAARTWSAASS